MQGYSRIFSLGASSPIWASLARTRERGASEPRGFAARSRVLARLASLAQIGELARRLPDLSFDIPLCNQRLFCLRSKLSNDNILPNGQV